MSTFKGHRISSSSSQSATSDSLYRSKPSQKAESGLGLESKVRQMKLYGNVSDYSQNNSSMASAQIDSKPTIDSGFPRSSKPSSAFSIENSSSRNILSSSNKIYTGYISHQKLIDSSIKENAYSDNFREKIRSIANSPNAIILEDQLVCELLNICQGVDSPIFRYDPNSQLHIPTKVYRVRNNQQSLIAKISRCGFYYSRIKQRITHTQDTKEHLRFAFNFSVNEQLRPYLLMLSAITANIKQQSLASSTKMKHSFTLNQLARVLEPYFYRLQYLDAITESCAQMKGGILINETFACTCHGSEDISNVFYPLMESLAGRLLHVIDQWIYDGHLDDPHQEFFIAVNPLVRPEMFWFDRFQLRRSMLPSFISSAQAKKILVTGKSVSFLSEVCKESITLKHWECIRNKRVKDPKSLYLNGLDEYRGAFDVMLSTTYVETCRYLLDVLMRRYNLRRHFSAIKRFILFGQGDFITSLMHSTAKMLELPSNHLNELSMINCLQGAIEDCPELLKEPTDVLDRVSTELISISPEDSGWDVFSLVYLVDEGPLCTIFSQECKMMYRIIFNFLWRVRRIDFVLWQLSADSQMVSNCGPDLSIDLEPIFHIVHQFRNEAQNFMCCLNHYIYIDVLETQWDEFGESLCETLDLDDVIKLQQSFLDRIMTQCLLAKQFCQLAAHLRKVFDTIIEFQVFFCQFADYVHKNKDLYLHALSSAKWSKVYKIERKDYDRRRAFVDKSKSDFCAKFNILRNFFRKSLIAFMLKLENENDEILINLVDQINLNGYYDDDMKEMEE